MWIEVGERMGVVIVCSHEMKTVICLNVFVLVSHILKRTHDSSITFEDLGYDHLIYILNLRRL